MVIHTTNATTKALVVSVRKNIQKNFESVISLLRSSSAFDHEEARKKLGRIYSALHVLKEDLGKEGVLKSDLIAVEILEERVLVFLKEMDDKTQRERVREAESLKDMAKTALVTD